MARIAVIVAVVALAALPAAAPAAPSSSLEQQLQNQVQQQPAPAPQSVPDPESTTIGPGTLLLVAVVIAGLIGGIWYVIARDARRATAGRMRTQATGGDPGRPAARAARRRGKPSAAERQR